MKKLLILFAAFLLAVSASAVSINLVNSYASSNNFQGYLNIGQIYPAPGGGGGFSLGSAITGTNGNIGAWMLIMDSFGNFGTNAVPVSGGSTSSNNFQGHLNIGQIDFTGNVVSLTSNQVIAMAGGSVAGSNYVTQALLAGSNFVSITTLSGSNFVSITTLAGSNFVNQVALANSNYVNQTALGSSNYVTATGLTTSNYLTTVTLTGPMTNNLMAGSAATNAFQPQSQNLTNWSTVATNVYVSIGTLAGSNFVSITTLAGSNFVSTATLAGSNYLAGVTAAAASTNFTGVNSAGVQVTVPWAGLPAGGSSTPNTLQTNTTQNAVTILNLIATNIISAATGQFTGNGAGLTNVNNTVYIVNTASTNANFQLFSSPTLYTVWKTNSANSMYLIGNGATNTIYGLAMVTVTVTGTNFLINY